MRGIERARWSVSAAAIIAAAGVARAQGPVLWRGEDPPIGAEAPVGVVMDRAALERVLGEIAMRDQRVVVTVAGVIDAQVIGELREAGVEFVSALGGSTCIARVRPDRLTRGVDRAAAVVASVGRITPAMRMHPALIAGDMPAHAVVDDDPVAGRTVAVAVQFHADATDAEIGAVMAAAGAIERSRARSVPIVTIEVPEVMVGVLASADAVAWIEPVLPGLTECNAGCRALVQADALVAAPYGLTGAGVGVLVYDGGRVLAGHADFQGRVTMHDTTPVSDHATHVAGTIGGAGVVTSANRGIAPGVTIRSFGFEYDGSGTFLATNPGDVESNWSSAFVGLGCRVGNASLGTNVEVNGFACSLQGDYTTTDALMDAIVRGSLGVPVRAVWAAGNERQANRCDVEGFGDYYSIAPPAGAKNPIIVGAVYSDTDQVASFSSWGPTDDGRLKPDVVAPGCQIGVDGGVTSTSSASTTAYTVKCGTSMAAPVVTGIVALMVEDYASRYPNEPPMTNALCKAVLIQSAKDIGAIGPDFATGYGSVRGKDAIDLVRSGRWAMGAAGTGEDRVFLMDVSGGTGPVRVTLAWDDAPGSPAVVGSLVNDLDLVVIDPSGARRYPWTLAPTAPSAPAVRTAEDHRNNVEQVVVDAPSAGLWTVIVRGTNVPSGGPQGFAIAATHAFVERSVELAWIDAPPQAAAPGEAFAVRVSAAGIGQEVDASTVVVRTRTPAGTGAWVETVMTPEGSGVFGAVVSGPSCDAGAMEVEVVAQGAEAGAAQLPEGAPAFVAAGTVHALMATNCEAADGWVVNATGTDTATAGAWGRMDPEPTAAQPGDDAPDAGAMCWVTDGRAGATVGSYDVDGGVTTLTSPVVDLAGARSARVTFWGWFSNTAGADPGTDVLVVRASTDGGATWQVIETIGPKGEDAGGGWFTRDIELVGMVAMTDAVRVRFEVSDVGLGSVVEAAVDDVRITAWWCDASGPPVPPVCAGDLNGDGVVNAEDFTILAGGYGMQAGATASQGDVNGDGRVDAADFAILAGAYGGECR